MQAKPSLMQRENGQSAPSSSTVPEGCGRVSDDRALKPAREGLLLRRFSLHQVAALLFEDTECENGIQKVG